ncbi:MAG: hypothetical protein JSS94_01200 [Bacteroidetes bacterium]|nr:hypothetical protein [Bacteroidota bacterium]
MKNYKFIKTVAITAFMAFSLSSCVKDDGYTVPTIQCNTKFAAATNTLGDLVALAKANPTPADIIATDYIVEAFVSSSDEQGNIYKMLFVQDSPSSPTQGVEIDIDGGNQYINYPVGAKLKINLKGLIVQGSNGNIKIGAYDPSYAVGRINPNKLSNYIERVCDGQYPVKADMIPLEFNSIGEALKNAAHINQLVKINNVQFEDPELTKTFADADKTGDRYIVDKKGGRLDLRFSNYASFAKTTIGTNYGQSGSIILNLSRFSTTDQAYIRSLNDIQFTEPRFAPGVPEDPTAAAVNLFNGADFENWPDFLSSVNSFGLKPYATQGIGQGFNGTNSLQILGTPPGNEYVFTSFAGAGLPANPKRIIMYIKGTSPGRSMSFNVYKASNNSQYYTFNLGVFKTGAILDPADNNQYTGNINTNGEWKKIELVLTGLNDINLTDTTKNLFAIKVGSGSAYNVQIDNIRIE